MKTKEIVILPYCSKRGQKEYLIKNETIENWDQHPDHCSISFEFSDEMDIRKFIKEKIDTLLSIDSVKYEFVDKEAIINNIDSQLIVAYTRLEFLRFK